MTYYYSISVFQTASEFAPLVLSLTDQQTKERGVTIIILYEYIFILLLTFSDSTCTFSGSSKKEITSSLLDQIQHSSILNYGDPC